MSRRKSIIFILLPCIFMMLVCTGCWNRAELNELAVVLAMGIDASDDHYEVTVQMVDPSQMNKNRVPNRSPTTTFTKRGATIFEAIRKITTLSSRKMYFSHMKLVVFDERTAKKGIKEPLDLLLRNPEIRPDFYLAVVRNAKAMDVMSYVTAVEILPAMDMFRSLIVSEQYWAPTAAFKTKDILHTLTRKGIEPVLTGMELTGDIKVGKTIKNTENPEVPGDYLYTGIGVFKKDRLLGWLNESDSKTYNYIVNNIKSTVGVMKCPESNGEFAVEVVKSKVKILPRIVEDKPEVTLDVNIESKLSEVGCRADLTDDKFLSALEATATHTFEKLLTSGVSVVQKKYKSDIYGFGEAFHRKYPKEWHMWRDDWDEKFSTLPVNININYNIREFGEIINPFENTK